MNLGKNLREAEQSPDGRYVRFDEKLGNGAYKEVFLSYDTETGKEVAWNAVTLARLPPNEKKRIRMETEILKELDHPHIINFYHVWENPVKDQICFTTEIVTSGTLKQYVARVRNVKLKVIKKWCRQILTALDYLHCHAPPIIHRDLKCDNIFINGGTGEIRIGDFGLSAARHTTHVESVLGTPEFMAPELYDENYSEKVDIYAFGMCVLEMTTKEYPYEECSNAAQIWKKVSMGQKPEVISRILNAEVKAFIEMCLMPADVRLSARELLKHPFLKYKRSDPCRDNITVAVAPRLSPTHREGKQEQREQLKQGIEARDKERLEKQLYNQSQQMTSSRHANNSSMDSTESLVSPPAGRPHQPSPSPTHQQHQYHAASMHQQQHLPPHINTNTPTPTNHGVDHHHQQQSHPSAAHSHPSQVGQPTSAHTPPARFSRQASLPNLVAAGQSGLSHSQSTQVVSSLHHPQPHRHHLAAPSVAPSNLSPDLIHVASVVVEVESTHTHFAAIALHIHFEAGTRRKKQIRFEFDFYRDTSDSIASEMVRALKLPDQERTARLIASNMELKIDPLRLEYYHNHGSNASMQSTQQHQQQASQQQQHPHPAESPSPSTSPASRTKTLPTTRSHDDRHPPPHPHPHPHSVTVATMPYGSKGSVSSGHYATLPSPQSQTPTQTKLHNPHHSTIPQPSHPTPKLSSAQPTNVGGPRPHTGSAKPPHPTTPHGASGARPNTGLAVSPQGQQQAKNLGNRRHSHDPVTNATVSDPLALTSMARTSSIPPNFGSHAQPQQQSPHTGPSTTQAGSAANAAAAGSGMRRSSSTSSLAFMMTPQEAETKQHHDRLYDQYRLYSIANLKEKIKERIRAKQAAKDGDDAGEAIELNGILEKNDLIESLIRLTPRTKQLAVNAASPITHTARGPSPPSPRDSAHESADHSQDSSQQSTPRIVGGAAYDYSNAPTPIERSRAPSMDSSAENALLGNYGGVMLMPVKSASTAGPGGLRLQDASHRSPSHSPSHSPLPSPAARNVADRKPTDADGESIASHHHAPPSSHRISHDHYKDASSHPVGIASVPLTRSSSSPNDLPELGRKKLVKADSAHQPASHDSTPAAASAAAQRNFTFPASHATHSQSGSGHTSPASTTSNTSYSSTGGGHADLDDAHRAAFSSALHVDVNPLSPSPSAPPSGGDLTGSPALPPQRHGTTSASSSSHLSVASAPPHLHTPQSPTIPEETGAESEEAGGFAHAVDAQWSSRSNVQPTVGKVIPAPSLGRHHTLPLTHSKSSHTGEGLNPPLGARRKDGQHSASADDLARMAPPSATNAAALAHLRTDSGAFHPPPHSSHSASSTPSARPHQPPTHHQRASSVLIGPHDHHDTESEDKKKLRLEAERTRLQKKTDAAKAAKMCEDKILSGLMGNFH